METNRKMASRIEIWEVGTLKPYQKNARTHSAIQVDQIVKSIEEFGFTNPILVDEDNGIIAGHGRLLAAKKLGMLKVPVVPLTHLTPSQKRAYVIADNKLALNAGWDEEMLKRELSALKMDDFDVSLTGFSDDELNELIPTDPDHDDSKEDDIPEQVDAVTKTGDLWLLGDHRVLCGDCTDPSSAEKLMEGEKADLVFTDPPYNLASDPKNLPAQALRPGSYGRLKDSEWDKNFDILPALEQINLITSDDCSVYVCTSHFLAGKIWGWMMEWATTTNVCVWNKKNPMPSLTKRHWTWSTELICYATKGKHVFNFPTEGHAKNVWEIVKNLKNDLHPTMKPVEVPTHAISHSSKNGMLVWDGFLGSGSTLIACEKTNRKCYGMEIDPHYCDVIVKRWEQYTGKKATLEKT